MVRKRGGGRTKSQSAIDFLMLTGIILVILVPLFYFSQESVHRRPTMVHNVLKMQDTVKALGQLGVGNADTIVMQVKGITDVQWESCSPSGGSSCAGEGCRAMHFWYADGTEEIITLDHAVCGSLAFWKIPGTHHVTFYNDGTNVVLVSCGDGVVSGFEQCEPCTSNNDCISGNCDLSSGILGTCVPPSGIGNYCQINGYTSGICQPTSSPNGCFCQCTNNGQCPGNLICNTATNTCEPCTSDNQCPSGTYCSLGACQSCDKDLDGFEGTYSAACGGTDCRDDPSSDPAHCGPTPVCSDPINSDCAKCINSGLALETSNGGNLACADNLDNDCNMLVDCNDPACGGAPICIAGCTPGSCPPGQNCNPFTNSCAAACTYSGTCPLNQVCNPLYQHCQEPCSGVPCPAGYVCNPVTDLCEDPGTYDASCNNLKALWQFEEPWGSQVRDTLGNHDGLFVYYNPIMGREEQGKICRSIRLSSHIQDHVDIQDHSDFRIDANEPFTIELWVKPYSTPGSVYQSLVSYIVPTVLPSPYTDLGYYVTFPQTTDPANPRVAYARDWTGAGGGTIDLSPPQEIQRDVWHHIALVRTVGPNQLIYYHNGVEIKKETDTSTESLYFVSLPTSLKLGTLVMDMTNFVLTFYKGELDEVAFYDAALPAATIQNHYANTQGQSTIGVCNTRCAVTPQCGDGVVEAGEQCGEPGLTCVPLGDPNIPHVPQPGVYCDRHTCQCETFSYCGDGIADRGEECGEPGISCTVPGEQCGGCQCEPTGFCGDGVINQITEQCEPRAHWTLLNCPAMALPFGFVIIPTACIDCQCRYTIIPPPGAPPRGPPLCPNGVLDPGEACDPGGVACAQPNQDCLADCSCVDKCGNGVVEPAFGEQCEKNDDCSAGETCFKCECVPTNSCPNGVLDPGEECDGNNYRPNSDCRYAGYNCNNACQCEYTAFCGNNRLDPGEECDGALYNPGSDCRYAGYVCDNSCNCILDIGQQTHGVNN